MSTRHVAGPSDRTVGDVLGRVEGGTAALADGRVFVGRVRVTGPEPVAPGDGVFVQPVRVEPDGVSLLGDWQGLVAAYKPADLPTEPDRQGSVSLVRALARLMSVAEAEIHAATRLDAPVSGIVVVARGPGGKRLARALQDQGRLHRRYVALLSGVIAPERGQVDLPIGRDARGRPAAGGREARPASTRFFRVAAGPGGLASLVAFEPITGRTHQIRIHAESLGAPILGDAQHGGPRRLVLPTGRVLPLSRLYLHAACVTVTGPGNEVKWSVAAPAPQLFVETWAALGGDGADLERALGGDPLDGGAPPGSA